MTEYFKQYYQKNKDRMKEKYERAITCPCLQGMKNDFKFRNKTLHCKSKKHTAYMERHSIDNHRQTCASQNCICQL